MTRQSFQSRAAAWLGLSTQEMKGFVLTLLAMALILSLPYAFEAARETYRYDRTRDQAALDSLLGTLELPEATHREQQLPTQTAMLEIKPFNPNELNAEEWTALGLKPYLAERAVKYRNKVSPFRVKKDLLKVYGFPEQLYRRLEPFILLPDEMPTAAVKTTPQAVKPAEKILSEERKISEKIPTVGKQIQKFDINTADTAQLIALKGIGTVTAARIIKFREALGGFYDIKQLQEVYGITPEALASLAVHATLTPDSHRKISINTVDAETLKKHPYIGNKLASVIINYRKQHGIFKNAEDLQKIRLITPEQLEKLLPYIEF